MSDRLQNVLLRLKTLQVAKIGLANILLSR